ncbi:MAG: glycosyltransferase family 2 protein [Dysgonamonadaceae bacterium]|jgi:glycosyltransferase involved in cell wall biosynthesis|nr:glycosyltransferase family 2 protein [Dysgonamonadaceae bacterium]
MSNICIVIPAYNNVSTLNNVVEDVKRYTENIIIINDGSTDTTEDLLNNYKSPIQIISYPKNMGKGFALKQGFNLAIKTGFKAAITFDADGQHSAENLPLFFKTHKEYPNAIITGSRNLKQPNMPAKNTFANKLSNFWFTVQTSKHIPDTQTGFRLYPLQIMKNIKTVTKRYEAELEILVRAAWKNIPIVPIPINVRYFEPNTRISHFHPVKDFLRISMLNTLLCFVAIIYGYPSMTVGKIKELLILLQKKNSSSSKTNSET